MTDVLVILLAWMAGLGAAAQFAKIAVTLPEFTALYPGYGAWIGWLVSLISLIGIVFGLFTGILANRLGVWRLLFGSLLIGVLVSLFQSLLPPFPVMLLSRFVEGICHLGIVVAAPTLIARTSAPRWRSAAMTLWGTFFGVAFAFTAWFGIPFSQAHGLAALLQVHAAYLGVVVVLLWVVYRRRDDAVQRAAAPGEPDTTVKNVAMGSSLDRHRRVYTSASIGAPAAGWFFYTFTFVAVLSVIGELASPARREVLSIAMPLASMLASLLIGIQLLRVFPATRVIIAGFLLAAGSALLALIADGASGVFIALFAALGLVQGASFAAVPQLNAHSSDQALANGAMAQTGNLGNFLGTPVIVAVLASSSADAVLWLVTLLSLTGALVHRVLAHLRGT